MSFRKVAIIQARMSSSRLPGKVLLPVGGKPLLQIMLERIERAKSLDEVVIATTTDPSDDILEQFCQEQGTPCYRGSLHDVLDRYYQAAQHFHAGVIVRLTADCPLIDPNVLDLTVAVYMGASSLNNSMVPQHPVPEPLVTNHSSLSVDSFDFAASRLPPPWNRTLPIGLDVEVCSFEKLEQAWKEAREPYQREHVMPFLYEGVAFKPSIAPVESGYYVQQGATPRGFKIALLNHDPDYGALRWTVDTPVDLEFIRQILQRFNGQLDFTWQDILVLLAKEPKLAAINAEVKHKTAFDVDPRNQSD